MTRKDIISCFENVKTSETQKQKMLNTILAGRNERVLPMKRKTRFSLASIAAVVAVFILCTGTALAMTYGWHEALLSYFNPTPEQVEILDETVGTPAVYTMHRGWTLSVIQTIADRYNVYVLYEIISEDENFVFPEETYVWARLFRSGDSSDGATSGSGTPVILENSGNKLLILQDFYSTAPTIDERVKLLIHELSYPTEEWCVDGRKVRTLFRGELTLQWELDYVHTGSTLFPDIAADIAGTNIIITQIEISPLSVVIFFEGDKVCQDSSFVTIRKRDGSEKNFGLYNESGYYSRVPINPVPGVECDNPEDGFSHTIQYIFDSIININDIINITVGNITIPVNDGDG